MSKMVEQRRSTRNPLVLERISQLSRRYPESTEHRRCLNEIGSDFVYAAEIPNDRRYEDVWITLLRLPTELEDKFGIYREIPAIYSPHSDIQGRTISRIDSILRKLPQERQGYAPSVVFFWAPDPRLATKLEQFSKTEMVFIPLIGTTGADQLKKIASLLYTQDLYRERTYVTGDQFFGRRTLLQSLRNDLRDQRVPAVFGTRKTGKTSILKEMVRTSQNRSETDLTEIFLYHDLEHLPSLKSGDPIPELLGDIAESIRAELKFRGRRTREIAHLADAPSVSEFRRALASVLQHPENIDLSIVLILDEIEHLCPPNADRIEPNPENEKIVQFLGVLRKTVQEEDNFNFAIAGLASAIVDSGELFGRLNPLFSLPNPYFLRPFNREESGELLTGIGARLGLAWSSDAIDAAHAETGGHVTLLREQGAQVLSLAPKDRSGKFRVTSKEIALITNAYRRNVRAQIKVTLGYVKRYYSDEYDLCRELINNPDNFSDLATEFATASSRIINLGLANENDGVWQPSRLLELGWDEAPISSGKDEHAKRSTAEMLADGEDKYTEFKSSARVSLANTVDETVIVTSYIKAVIGFLNTDGGTVLLGVNDSGAPIGLGADLESLQNSKDKLILFITNKLNTYIGKSSSSLIGVSWDLSVENPIIKINVRRGSEPTFSLRPISGKSDQLFVRQNANTMPLTGMDSIAYSRTHFG